MRVRIKRGCMTATTARMAGTAPACCFSRAGDVVALASPSGLKLHGIVASQPHSSSSYGSAAPIVVSYPKLSLDTLRVGPIKIAHQIQSTPLFVLVGCPTESAAAAPSTSSSASVASKGAHSGGKAHKMKQQTSGRGSAGAGAADDGSDATQNAASRSQTTFRGSDRVVSLYDAQNDQVLSEVHCETAVLNVLANTSRLVIILERTTYLYDLLSMRLIQQFRTTTPVNRLGLGTLSEVTEAAGGVPGTCFYAFPSSGAFYMVRTRSGVDASGILNGAGGNLFAAANGGAGQAQPLPPRPSQSSAGVTGNATPGPSASAFHSERRRGGDSVATSEFLFEYDSGAGGSGGGGNSEPPSQAGDVVLVDGMNGAWIGVVAAHRHSIVSLVLSGSGSRMATCSAQGTNIHVYSIPSGQLMFQLRRGQASSRIWGLQFNRTAEMLVASSSTGTVHLFYIGAKDIRWVTNSGGGGGATSTVSSSAVGAAPKSSSMLASRCGGVVITKGVVIGETGIRSFGKIRLATSSRVTVASFSENSRVLTIAIAPSAAEGSQSGGAAVDRRWLLASYRVDCDCRQLGETLLEG